MSDKQLIEMIAQGQAQRIAQNRQNEQMMAEFNQWKQQQQMASLMSEFDAWKSANAPQPQAQPVQQTVNQVKEQPKQESIPSLADFFTPTTASGKNVNKEAAKKFQREDYQRQQQKENMLASNTQKSVKKDNGTIGSGINQLDLNKYNLPSDKGITEQDKKDLDDYTKALQWVDTNYRMTKEEQKEARRIASEGLQKIAEKYPVENKSDFGKLYERMSPEDLQKYRMYEDLDDKANTVASMSVGAADKAVSMLGGALNTYALFHPEGWLAAKNYKRDIQDNWDKIKEPTVEIAKSATPIAENVPLIGEITPYGVGEMATQMGAYALTNNMFDEVGTALLGNGKIGGFVGNQIGQNLQDVALDTAPLIQELAKDGSLSKEDWGQVGGNVGLNALGNVLLGGATEIPALAKWIKNKSATKKAAEAATRETIAEGAEKLAKLANMEDVDNIVKNATDQAETAVKNIEDIARQAPETPEVELTKPRPGGEMPTDPSIKAEADRLIKASEAEEADRLLTQEMEDQLLYDFDNIDESYFGNREAIRNALENKDFAIKDSVINTTTDKSGKTVYQLVHAETQKPIKTFKSMKAAEKAQAEYAEGTVLKEKAIKAFDDIRAALADYQKAAFESANVEEVNTAKKAVEAARKRYERAMKELDPDYYDVVSSRDFADRITKPYYTRNPAAENPVDEELMDELVNDWVKQDVENPNRFVRDAEPDTKVMAEDIGLNNEPKGASEYIDPETGNFVIEENIPDKGAYVKDGQSRVVTNSAINADIVTKQDLETDPVIQDIAKYAKHNNDITFAEAYDRVKLNGKQWRDDYISGAKAIDGDTDVDTSMLLLQDLKNKMDNASDPKQAEFFANKRNALLRKLREYGTKSGQGIQAFAKWNNTADGAMLCAEKLLDDDVVKWKSRNQKATLKNSRIAQALADMGNKWKSGKNAPNLTHDQIKEGVIAEIQREVGSVEKYFNDNDIEFLTQMAEDKSIPVWQITSEIEHKLKTGEWYTLDESIPLPEPTNTKLQNALNALVTEQIRAEKPAPDIKQITEEVRNTIAKEFGKVNKKFTDDDIDYIANLINNNATKQELVDALDNKLATGTFGISAQTQQRINELFKEANLYDPNSKQFVEKQLEAFKLLAEEIAPKATALEKYDTWRYLAMLGNPKTMLRNLVGNQMFGALTGLSNTVAAVGEAGVDKGIKGGKKALNKLFNTSFDASKGIQRTKSVLNLKNDWGLIKAAAADGEASRYRQMIGSKYEKMDKDFLRQQRSVFNSKLLRLYEKATDAGISDYSSVKNKFSTSLAGYLKANGYDKSIFNSEVELARLKNIGETRLLSDAEEATVERLTKDVAALNKARDFALSQAEYATFHEKNVVADLLTKWSKEARGSDNLIAKGLGYAIEGTVPFKKTPANILRSGVEYSPLGAIDSLIKTGKLVYENTGKRAGNLADTYLTKSGKEVSKTLAADVIDSWSKTLTGSGMALMGYMLYKNGALKLSDEDTKYQDQLEGIQNYSVEINGKTYTLDWAVPSFMPLALGAEIAKMQQASGKTDEEVEKSFSDYLGAADRMLEPMVETSMLSGVKDTLETAANAAKYNGVGSLLTTLPTTALSGYATQAIPTISGQIARTVDNTRRSTYSPQEDATLRSLDTQRKKIMNKIPGLSMLNQPFVDTYGREQKNSPFNNPVGNLAYQMLSPSYISNVNTTKADKVSREAFGVSNKASTLPEWQSYFKDSDGKRVSAEDYTTAAKAYGEANKEIRDALGNSEWFKGLSDTQKEEIVKGINTISEHVGNAAIDPNYEKDSKPYNAYKDGGIPGLLDYYKTEAAKDTTKELLGDSGVTTNSKAGQAITQAVANGNMSEAQRLAEQAKADKEEQIKTEETKETLSSYGLTNIGPTKTYEKAQTVYSGLSTKDFAKTYKGIDSNGNQGIDMKELESYINSHAKSDSEAQKLWEAYGGGWKNKAGKVKKLVKKNGKWVSTYNY